MENDKNGNTNNDLLNKKTLRAEDNNNNSPKRKKLISFKKLKVKDNLTKLESIQKYKEKRLKEWDDRSNSLTFNLKEFVVNLYDIHNDSQKLYIKTIINEDKKEINFPLFKISICFEFKYKKRNTK